MLSARGVAGEGPLNANVRSLVERYGAKVPCFSFAKNEQLLDKSALLSVKPNEAWRRTGVGKTWASIKEARSTADMPDLSYDIDGDGYVGARDYFIGKHFDKDRDNKLNEQERATCDAALANNWLEQFSFGHDQAGARRPFPVTQYSECYPPHPMSTVTPRYQTKTDMLATRKAVITDEAKSFREHHFDRNPLWTTLPPRPPSPLKRLSLSMKKEEHRRETRKKAGLTEEAMEIMTHVWPSTDYVAEPKAQTRTDMVRQRLAKKLVLDDQTLKETGANFIPSRVRQSMREALIYESSQHPRFKTRTAMLLNRCVEKRRAAENLAAAKTHDNRLYSTLPMPWYQPGKKQERTQERPTVPASASSPKPSETPREPPLKGIPYAPREPNFLDSIASPTVAGKTVKRFSTQLLREKPPDKCVPAPQELLDIYPATDIIRRETPYEPLVPPDPRRSFPKGIRKLLVTPPNHNALVEQSSLSSEIESSLATPLSQPAMRSHGARLSLIAQMEQPMSARLMKQARVASVPETARTTYCDESDDALRVARMSVRSGGFQFAQRNEY